LLSSGILTQLAFYRSNQFFALLIHLILRVKQRLSFQVALCLQRLDLLLACEFFFQRQCGRGGAAGFLDLAVKFLDLTLQPYL
jgi:hypothetical protein